LLLSFYILPAFAAILKIRAKKLAQINATTTGADVVSTGRVEDSIFFENVAIKINGLS
jgi:hypothetical protein